MTYDPYQSHSALGAYPGLATPLSSPYLPLNPVTAFNPLATAYPLMGGIIPQLHLAQILAARAAVPQLLATSPWTNGLTNPLLAAAVLQNPLLAATLENPLLNPALTQTPFGVQSYPFSPFIGQPVPQLGQIAPQFGQIGSPPFSPFTGQPVPQLGQIAPQFGQIGSPYGQILSMLASMLAPQSWVGQAGLYGSHPLSQVHPLVSQLIGRGFPGAGIFPTSL